MWFRYRIPAVLAAAALWIAPAFSREDPGVRPTAATEGQLSPRLIPTPEAAGDPEWADGAVTAGPEYLAKPPTPGPAKASTKPRAAVMAEPWIDGGDCGGWLCEDWGWGGPIFCEEAPAKKGKCFRRLLGCCHFKSRKKGHDGCDEWYCDGGYDGKKHHRHHRKGRKHGRDEMWCGPWDFCGPWVTFGGDDTWMACPEDCAPCSEPPPEAAPAPKPGKAPKKEKAAASAAPVAPPAPVAATPPASPPPVVRVLAATASRAVRPSAEEIQELAASRSPATLLSRGFTNYWEGRYTAALAHFEGALVKDPSNPHTWYGKALAERALGEQASASASLRKAVRLQEEVHIPDADFNFLLERLSTAEKSWVRAARAEK